MEFFLWLIVAFGGGVFGAAIGPQTAFIFTCFMYLTGIAAAMGTSGTEAAGAGAILGAVAFGPVFGPHIAWAGGAAGSAYAAKKGYLDFGRDVVTPLPAFEKLDVFVVAGAFGMVGYLLNELFSLIPTMNASDGTSIGSTDTIAMAVVASHILARLAFGKRSRKIFGPFGQGISPFGVEPGHHWVQHQEKYSHSAFYGLFFGLIFAFGSASMVQHFPDNDVVVGFAANLGWAISGVSLIFITFGHKTPVTHHMTLIAGLGAVTMLKVLTGGDLDAITDGHMFAATIFGAVFGAISGLLGEVLNRLTNARGDTHIDPPAFAIFPLTTVLFAVQALAL